MTQAGIRQDSETGGATVAPPPELADWLAAIAERRDRQAFAQLFQWFAPRVKRYMQRQGADPDLAEDLAQETLVQVWRKAGQYDPGKAVPSAWVFTVARNLRIDRLRRQRLYEVELTEEADAEDEHGDGHQRTLERLDAGRLTALVGALPAEQVDVIRLAYFEGLSHAEVGKALAVPLGTVKSRLRLALAKLRTAMGVES
jgi:RNA polymerase sigma-70 factor (ECF subfamily)